MSSTKSSGAPDAAEAAISPEDRSARCAARSSMKAVASAQTNVALATPLCCAFCRASRMAASTLSTPITRCAPRLAATSPIVPVPQ